jgi:site-specific DNA-methyltransferase (adenine-specific)
MNTATLMSSARHDWRTPRALFDRLSAMAGGFYLDAAADRESTLAPIWFGPGGLEPDALATEWANRGGDYGHNQIWLNPPYGRELPKFIAKAVEQVAKHPRLEVWALVPARTDTRWWQLAMTRAVQVYFLAGRVRFETPEGAKDPAPFPSAVIRLGHTGGNPSVVWGFRA